MKYYFRKKKYEPIKELREIVTTLLLKRIFKRGK